MVDVIKNIEGSCINLVPIKRALISVFDKDKLLDIANLLSENKVEILSTGGTANAMRNAGIKVTDVSEFTGSPEILNGRVKTLHPKVHGGILAVRGNKNHESDMTENNFGYIDLVIMNLYPFEEAVKSGSTFETCIENIDIGGPSMLRSSSKNHKYVTILSSPAQYEKFIAEITNNNGCTSLEFRKKLAYEAFSKSSEYEEKISSYFLSELELSKKRDLYELRIAEHFRTENTNLVRNNEYKCISELKYGCNPHQNPAAIYNDIRQNLPFEILNGKPGYINLLDALNAWQLVNELRNVLDIPAAASFKHCSPAGAAVGIPLTESEKEAYEISDEGLTPTALAYLKARNADPMCSFGDFAAISDKIDVCTANVIKATVCDGIIAPDFEPEALEILKSKKKGAFVILKADQNYIPPDNEYREVYGVTFKQKRNNIIFNKDYLSKVVTLNKDLPESAVRDLILASICIKYTQSNSVGYSCNGQMIGVGAGQQSRVDCVKLAGRKVTVWYLRQHPKVKSLKFKSNIKKQDRINARVRYIEGDITENERINWIELFDEIPEPLTELEKIEFMKTLNNKGVCIGSDAFFPFRDSIDHASKWGVKYIAQPGGSIADEQVIEACNEYGMTMAFTNVRFFHH